MNNFIYFLTHHLTRQNSFLVNDEKNSFNLSKIKVLIQAEAAQIKTSNKRNSTSDFQTNKHSFCFFRFQRNKEENDLVLQSENIAHHST